ncbi:hypothetical protein HK096_010425 [Nowakowskiella sp. JEL0078]|nr:hypothetical protein HK096_010425 [Nowakowskiella sp. JEL0078]
MSYLPWSKRITTIFHTTGIYDSNIVSCAIPTATADRAIWDIANYQALQLIKLAVKNSDLPHVHSSDVAAVAWDNLQDTYNNSAVQNHTFLIKNLVCIKKTQKEKYTAYLKHTILLAKQIYNAGSPISNDKQITYTVSGLVNVDPDFVKASHALPATWTLKTLESRFTQLDAQAINQTVSIAKNSDNFALTNSISSNFWSLRPSSWAPNSSTGHNPASSP